MARRQQVKAQANNDHWQTQYRRFKELLDRQVIGKARFDEVETAWRAAEAIWPRQPPRRTWPPPVSGRRRPPGA
jgi:multidrug resistance efflux pump